MQHHTQAVRKKKNLPIMSTGLQRSALKQGGRTPEKSSLSLSTDLSAPELNTPHLLKTHTHILPHKAQEHEENKADQPPCCRKRLGHG